MNVDYMAVRIAVRTQLADKYKLEFGAFSNSYEYEIEIV